MQKYVAFDFETTGTEPGSRPVELAMLEFTEDGAITNGFECLIDPQMPIPSDTTQVHGITDEMVRTAETFTAVAHAFLDWIDPQAILIAHYAPFDIQIASWALGYAGLRYPENLIIDTCAMAKRIKATRDNKLETLIDHYQISAPGKPHRAMHDADACRQYFMLARELTTAAPEPWCPTHEFTSWTCSDSMNFPDLIKSGAPFAFTYEDAKGGMTERSIIPYGWAGKLDSPDIMFHGHCLLRGERRTFNTTRILKVLNAA
ncbi:MAG: 3'-5' exoribonuclease [Gammaproteobacteria bacterium]|nr:3'-5' exoribonuclease [Gammaproteobacteria bacterium]